MSTQAVTLDELRIWNGGATAEDLQSQVKHWVRQLNSPELSQRADAEQQLIALGPTILDLLPPLKEGGPANEAQQRDTLARIRRVLENESACNTASGSEAAKVLDAVKSTNFMLNWDPGNAAASGEIPYPDGYNLLPKDRIGHCHCKDAIKKDKHYDWAPMGGGLIDWGGQFKALKRDGYHFAVSLETHWRGAGSAEESTRKSWAGMKTLLQQADAL